RPFAFDLSAQGQVGIQQPGSFGEANAFKVKVLAAIVRCGMQVGGGVYRKVAGVLEDQGGFDLLGLLRGGGKKQEIDVLAACGLFLQAAAEAAAAAHMEQVGDLIGKGDGFSQWLGGKQRAAQFLPLTTEGIQYAI